MHCPKVFTTSRAMSCATPLMSSTPSPGARTPSFPTTRPSSTYSNLLSSEIEPCADPRHVSVGYLAEPTTFTPKRRFVKPRSRLRTSAMGSWKSICPPCVGGNYWPKRARSPHIDLFVKLACSKVSYFTKHGVRCSRGSKLALHPRFTLSLLGTDRPRWPDRFGGELLSNSQKSHLR